ncbi:MAG: hypothetical protein AAF211_08075, partial [Myxococcota bacterium]
MGLWILVACNWGAPEPPVVTDAWLAETFVETAREARPGITVVPQGPLTFVVELPDGSTSPIDLANLRGECDGATRSGCRVAIDRWVRVVLDPPDDDTRFTPESLRLVLQSRRAVAATQRSALPWGRPFAGDLLVYVVADLPDT